MYRPLTNCLILLLIAAASAQLNAQNGNVIPPIPSTQIFPLADVKAGLKGTARTVFQGDRPEEFGVDILGIIPGSVGPHQDMIIGRLSGANALRTQVFAGMSGSPVYIDGKLVGAIAYSFAYAKEPICGITPIEQMLSVFHGPAERSSGKAHSVTLSTSSLLAENWRPQLPPAAIGPVVSSVSQTSETAQLVGGRFMPITTPLMFSGISQQILDRYAGLFADAGITAAAVPGGGAGVEPLKKADAETLVGGRSVTAQLARGDISIAAAGTVTLRDGDRIYAFGHPWFNLGSTSMPMSESSVVVVVPSLNNSFKMSVPGATVGSLTQDRATGVFGTLGVEPRMLPIAITMTNSRGAKTSVNFESAINELLTPLIVNLGIQNTITAGERNIGDTTIDVAGEIKLRGLPSIIIDRRMSGSISPALSAAAFALPVSVLLNADYPNTRIDAVNIDMKVSEGSRTAVLERVTVDRERVRPGESINVTAYLRSGTGSLVVQDLSVPIPKDTPAGPISLMVADGGAVQEASPVKQLTAKNAAELVTILNSAKRPDRLYAVLTRNTPGFVVGASEMPNLPPSILATIGSPRASGGPKATASATVWEQQFAGGQYIVSGSQTIALEIVR